MSAALRTEGWAGPTAERAQVKIGGREVSWAHVGEALWRILVFVVALVILVMIITRWNAWQGGRGWRSTDDAYLQSDVTPVSVKVAGYVRSVPVQDFERVKAGQLVAEIVDDDYRAAAALAAANLKSAEAQLGTLGAQQSLQEANVAAARDVVASTSANLAQNARDTERQRQLQAIGSSTIEAAERLATAREQLTAQLSQNRAQVEAAQRQIGVLKAQGAQAAAAIEAQKANLRNAEINLGYTRIVAPADGVLGQRQIRPGQYAAVGGQITTLTPLPRVWVVANFKETQLTHMAVGDRAEIRVDTFPGHVLKGHVQSFAPGSGSQFALLPPDNATGNFTKVVQRVAVKILIDDSDGLGDRLRPGLSVVAKVNAQDGRPQDNHR
jgi:membrane fusion protein (multidrug efflux system)